MLEDGAPFMTDNVVPGQTSTRLPAAVALAVVIGCGVGNNGFAFVPPQAGEPARFHKPDELPVLGFLRRCAGGRAW